MGRWVKLLGPYWCRTVIGSELLRHAATQGLPGQCTSMEVGTCGDMWGPTATTLRSVRSFEMQEHDCNTAMVFYMIYFNLFQSISIYFNLFQSISIYFNLFQSISIVSFKYLSISIIFTICKYNGCFFTLPGTSNDELKQVLKTHRAAASRGLFVSGKRGQRTNQRFSCAALKQNNPRKDAQIQSAQFSNQFIQELIAVRE